MSEIYTKSEVEAASLKYFNGDELATSVFITKYALRDNDGNYLEDTPDKMHHRLASEFARIENNYKNPKSEQEIYDMFYRFKHIVPAGSPMFGIGNDNSLMSLSNCVVVAPPKDSISGIMDSAKDLANLFKYRCGVGIDISSLRPSGDSVNNSARTTTGAWSFSELYSHVVNMVGQNGRRGALMVSIEVSHPDIEKFVTMKIDLKKVTGANISVKLSGKFMEAVEKNSDFNLEWKGKIYKTVNAKELMKLITETATATAEPGILFWDNIKNNIPLQSYSEVGFDHIGVNPCAELALSAYDSCRLISLNMSNFVIDAFDDPIFDYKKFEEVVRFGVRLSDDLIDLEIEKLNKIINTVDEEDVKNVFIKLRDSAKRGRRTGLGTHGLADMLVKLNLIYGSDDAINFVSKIYNMFKNYAYSESAILADERGSFEVFDWDKEKNNSFILSLEGNTIEEIKEKGRRNGSLLTIAPTGSTAIVSMTSSGIEPIYRLSYVRRKKINNDEVVEPDFIDEVGVKWKEFEVYHPLVRDYINKKNCKISDLTETFVTSDKIVPLQRIKMQSVIQEGIDHQISSTINLPKGTTADVVSDIYINAYKNNLKGITVYVDGSRSGVLVEKENKKSIFIQKNAPKRLEKLPCDIHQLTVAGERWIVFVGLLDGKPYEVFGGKANKISIPKRYTNGSIIKCKRKTTRSIYDLVVGSGDDELFVKDIVETFDNPTNLALTRLTSLSLRHGTHVKYLVEQLQKDKDSDLFSFSKSVARVLKKYIPDGEKSNEKCESCGSSNMQYENGCSVCVQCGYSKCS